MNLAPGTFHGLEPREVELFKRHLDGMDGLGLEIGCCDGYSTAHILSFSKMRLISVDPLVCDPVEKHLIGCPDRLAHNLAPFKWRHEFYQTTSQHFSSLYSGEDFDFIFIDGDHSLEGVLTDCRLWLPRLKTGGLLAMHDCRMNRPGGAMFHTGPSVVADDLIFGRPDKWQIVDEVFSLLLARKL
jgi:hypothetical protein